MTIPLVSCLPRTYPISSIKEETKHVKTFSFSVSFRAKPGQFLMLWLPGIDEVPMSVAMDNGKETKITFFDIGDMTKALFKKRVGDLIGLRGPFGTYYEWEKGQHLILVAGGYGAAPMYFVAQEALKDNCSIDFIVGARNEEHLLYIDEIGDLKNTELHIATDDGSRGHKGYNTEVLEKLLDELCNASRRDARHPFDFAQDKPEELEERSGASVSKETRIAPQHDVSVFACGPELMMKRISEICAEKKVPCAMSLERYMKCGYGLCGSCTVDPLGIRLCIDGPVVSNDIIQKITEFGKYHRDDLGKKHNF